MNRMKIGSKFLDSKGNSSIIKPVSTVTKNKGSNHIVYPPLAGGSSEFKLVESCFDKSFELVQSAPIEQDAVLGHL